MANYQHALHELCRHVAAEDLDAREKFNREVAPLIGVIARHALSRIDARSAGLADSSPASVVKPMPQAVSDRESASHLASRICRALIDKVRIQSRQPGAETLVRRIPRQTQLSPVQS
jgi:hypothetical protein